MIGTYSYICQRMQPRILLNSKVLDITIKRLARQLIENHGDFENTVLIGLQPRGIQLADRLHAELKRVLSGADIDLGYLDVSFYRDDFRRRDEPITVSETTIDFEIENKKVIMIDDVLYTGRTIRSGMDALMDFGRPKKVEFLVLIDRRFSRQLPIQADYVGRTVDSVVSERVDVNLDNEGHVVLKTIDDE